MALFTRRALLAGTGAALACTGRAFADEYPSRPVTIAVAYSAGSAPDGIARVLQPHLQKALGQPIVVEPQVGGSGSVALSNMLNRASDGYVVVLTGAANFVMQPHIAELQYDALSDITQIANVASVPYVYYSNPEVPARNLAEFVAYAKENPGKLNYATPGAGTTVHFTTELLMQIVGMDMVHVPFKGGPGAITALLANEVQFFAGTPSNGKAFVESGRLTALGVSSAERMTIFPDVPTALELGIDQVVDSWWSLSVPAATSPNIVDQLRRAVRDAFEAPEVRQYYERMGMIIPDGPEDLFAQQIRRQSDIWKKVIEETGLSIDK